MTNAQTVAVNIEEIKADEIQSWLQETLNINSSQGYTREDESIDLSFNNNKKTFYVDDESYASEIITVNVYADRYEVETLNAKKEYKYSCICDAEYIEASNKRTIKKLATLKNWIEKRLA